MQNVNIMRHLFALVIGLFLSVVAFAQQPVTWKYSAKKVGAKTYEVRLTAVIQSSWHIYSQSTPDGGPLPTKIVFSKNPLITQEGVIKEVGKLHKKYEEVFGVDVMQFSDKVEFVQVIKTKAEKVKTNVSGTIEFMVCTDEQCLPPATINFNIALTE